MSILQEKNIYTTKYGVHVPKAKITGQKQLTDGQRATMCMQLAVINCLLFKAHTTFIRYKKLADIDEAGTVVVNEFAKFMDGIGHKAELMQKSILNDRLMTAFLYNTEKMINPYVDKVLNYLNFNSLVKEIPVTVEQEGHYRAESLDKDPFGNSNTTLDLIIIAQGKGYRCIETNGTFKSHQYKDLKNNYTFFKINNPLC